MNRDARLTTFQIGSIYGVTPGSLRFYEEEGLLSPAIENGVRYYSNKDRIKLELINKGKRLGFSLMELKVLLLQTVKQRALHDLSSPDKPQLIQSLAREELVEQVWQAEKKIEDLQRQLRDLKSRLAADGQGMGD